MNSGNTGTNYTKQSTATTFCNLLTASSAVWILSEREPGIRGPPIPKLRTRNDGVITVLTKELGMRHARRVQSKHESKDAM